MSQAPAGEICNLMAAVVPVTLSLILMRYCLQKWPLRSASAVVVSINNQINKNL